MKITLPLRLFLMMVCLASSSTAMAETTETEALNLLRNMTQSFAALSYDGVFVHSEATNMNSMRVRHDSMAGIEYESLVDLDGDKVEILRIEDKIVSVYPNAHVANRRTPLTPLFKRFKNLESDRLLKGYDMQVNRQASRIAGRETVAIKLTPKDAYRYGHQFWLDKQNHFLLKHDMIGADNQLLERIQFTSVDFSPDLKHEDFVPKKDSYSEPMVETQSEQVKNPWQFDWLPEGFSLVWPEARSLESGTSMLLLSDGMTTVSVFIRPTERAAGVSILNIGATMAGECSIKVEEALYLLTLVGEVPKQTIEKLMAGFSPKVQMD
ncbi:MucB/RseB C-terminal domain-containing protein [Marinomonas algarum]|uniref:MucB/RseB C-terminal domain-containing protein n=1 Tax=Marinomonas algarum TaxID=2883105 RepID=A0A9X1IK23_9GAMM|nr:MucB/RseB C-terminal domain-containing protein [Marinomonas algarum]MCB5160959.1 MucB/RseB C-terminal domain-containing protein [Marinomonas algarum]